MSWFVLRRRSTPGTWVRRLGSSFLFSFRDITAALGAADDIATLVAAPRSGDSVPPAVRVGLHCCAAGRRLTNAGIRMIAQVTAMGDPGQVFVTGSAAELVPEVSGDRLRLVGYTEGLAGVSGQRIAVHSWLPETPAEEPARSGGDSGRVTVAQVERTLSMSRSEVMTTAQRSRVSARAVETPTRKLVRRPARSMEVFLDGSAYVVDRTRPALQLGRQEDNDIVLTVPTASRHHGRIEYRDGQLYYVDTSSNGTYVYGAEGGVDRIHQEPVELVGAGMIAPGSERSTPESQLLYYRITAAPSGRGIREERAVK